MKRLLIVERYYELIVTEADSQTVNMKLRFKNAMHVLNY